MTGLVQAFGGADVVVLQAAAQVDLTIALGGALVFFSLSLVPWGVFGMGGVNPRSAGIVSAIVGALGVIWAVFIFPIDAATAAVVGSFGIAFLSAGGHTFFDVDLAGHGLLCLVLAGVVAIVAITFTLAGGTPYLTFSLWTYVVVLVAFFGGSYYGTDRWLQAFSALCFFTGVITTGLFGALLITANITF